MTSELAQGTGNNMADQQHIVDYLVSGGVGAALVGGLVWTGRIFKLGMSQQHANNALKTELVDLLQISNDACKEELSIIREKVIRLEHALGDSEMRRAVVEQVALQNHRNKDTGGP